MQAEHVWGEPSPRGRMGKGQRGSKGGWCWELTAVARTSPPHWEHTQLTLGKGLPEASQIPRDDSNGSYGFRTQAAPPCCLSFSAMYHAIAIKMQSFYSLHNFNYFNEEKKIQQHYIQMHAVCSFIYWIKLACTDLSQRKTVTPSIYLSSLFPLITWHLSRNFS